MAEVDVAETLKTLNKKIDELSDMLIEKKGDVSKAFIEKKDKAEEKIKENPLGCVGGAFLGGLFLGYLVSRKN